MRFSQFTRVRVIGVVVPEEKDRSGRNIARLLPRASTYLV